MTGGNEAPNLYGPREEAQREEAAQPQLSAEPPFATPQQHFARMEAADAKEEAPASDEARNVAGNASSDADEEGGEPTLRDLVVGACRSVYDPEIPVNIYDLGLIYTIEINPDQTVDVDMTLTSPACPVAGTLPPEVEQRIREVPGVQEAKVSVVWDPPWHPGMMTEDAALELGFM